MTATAQLGFDYGRQEEWGGVCNTGAMRQSPINIVTADVQESDELIPLEFDERWTASLDGVFLNNGHGVRFIDSGEKARLRNHLGEYELLNFHLHWGPQDDNGTGHEFDGLRVALEFHFVTVKIAADVSPELTELGPDSAGDTLSVVCVLGEANDSLPLSDIWEQIDPSLVRNAEDVINITGLSYPSFLPDSKDYYHYEGSTTSPGCFEAVQWFILKEKVQVPSAYLTRLRTTHFDSNATILLNYREPQPLLGRTVLTLGSVGQTASVLVLVGSALLVLLL